MLAGDLTLALCVHAPCLALLAGTTSTPPSNPGSCGLQSVAENFGSWYW